MEINVVIRQNMPVNVTVGGGMPVIVVKLGLQGPPGPGDMKKEIYDADNDGIVDTTESIDGGSW